MNLNNHGRIEIYTDERQITADNVIAVLRDGYGAHLTNMQDIDYLIKFEAGEQPILREKIVRPEIDNHVVDNVAAEITAFNLGYHFGNPITLSQRGVHDSNDDSEEELKGISLLNEQYERNGIFGKTQKLGRYIETCGIGYTFVDVKGDWSDGESYFDVQVLDPRYTFVIRSSYYVDRRIMLACTFRIDRNGNRHFTCFTQDRRYDIDNLLKIVNGEEEKNLRKERWLPTGRSGEVNPLGMIPIVEWVRDYDRQGCFERQIPELNALNLLSSDIINDVDQNTQAIWFSTNVSFAVDEYGEPVKPKDGDWVNANTTADGKTPTVNPLVIPYDYNGMLSNYITRRSLILQKCFVPQRSDTSGGSTGVAMSDATGWSAAEQYAAMQQAIIESCKMEEVKLVLSAISVSGKITEEDSCLRNLRYWDIKPSIKRQRTYELTTKINFFATAVSHGIYGLHALRAMNAFEDVNQVWEDSKEGIEKYQKSIFEKGTRTYASGTGWGRNTYNNAVGGDGEKEPDADRLSQDYSDQVDNSPGLKR